MKAFCGTFEYRKNFEVLVCLCLLVSSCAPQATRRFASSVALEVAQSTEIGMVPIGGSLTFQLAIKSVSARRIEDFTIDSLNSPYYQFTGGHFPGLNGTCGNMSTRTITQPYLDPGESCVIEIVYTPTGPQRKVIQRADFDLHYRVVNGARDNVMHLHVEGMGGLPGTIQLSPSHSDFPVTPYIGTNTETVTFLNTGDFPATGVTTNLNTPEFQIGTTTCGSVLDAGQSCQATIVFSPVFPNSYFTTFRVDYHNVLSQTSISVPFNGQGTIHSDLVMPLHPTNYGDFGHGLAVSKLRCAFGGGNEVEVFERTTEQDPWIRTLVIRGIDYNAGSNSQFGKAISLYGDMMVVGASMDSTPVGHLSGAVYVFQFVGNSVNFVQRVTINTGNRNHIQYDYFGHSVRLWGDVLVAGAYMHQYDLNWNPSYYGAGAAWVLRRGSDGMFHTEQKLIAPPNRISTNLNFGRGIELRDQTLLVPVGGYNGNRGIVFVYRYDPTTHLWSLTQELFNPQGPNVYSAFGGVYDHGVDIEDTNGGTLAIGAAFQSRVYIFKLDASGQWVYDQSLNAPSYFADQQWGRSVGVAGDTLIVGSVHTNNPTMWSGASFMLKRRNSASPFFFGARLPSPGVLQGDWLGWFVAAGDGVAASYAPYHVNSGSYDQNGAIFFYY